MELKKLRNWKHLSLRGLAKLLNVSHTTISMYERGICDPSIENLIKMADIFGVSVDTLLGHNANIIDMNTLDEYRKSVINKVVYELNDLAVAKVDGYIDNIKNDSK